MEEIEEREERERERKRERENHEGLCSFGTAFKILKTHVPRLQPSEND